jgi:hypothetical protein
MYGDLVSEYYWTYWRGGQQLRRCIGISDLLDVEILSLCVDCCIRALAPPIQKFPAYAGKQKQGVKFSGKKVIKCYHDNFIMIT